MNTNNQKISEFMQLYKPVQHQLSAYCRVVTGSEEKALDLIQETLTTAFEKFNTLRKPESFQFFLIAIARNCYLKQKRTWKFFGNQTEIKQSDYEFSSDSVEMQYDFKLLHKCISSLNAQQRETILMFYLMGIPIKEISKNLNISEAAVKNRLMRGREKLRELLSDSESQILNNISAKKSKTT